MNDPFLVLALFWGPTLLATGIGILVSPAAYAQVYRDLVKQPLAVLVTGLLALNLGLLQVLVFEQWNAPSRILMSLLGWMLLLKGVALVVIPRLVERSAERWEKRKLLPVSGGVLVAIGIYFTYQVASNLF